MDKAVNTARVVGTTFRARNTVPFALAVAAVAAFSFLSGGYVIGRSTPVAVALLCAAAVWVWFLRRSTLPSRVFLVALAVFAAFAVWTGISVLWSFGPDLTWIAFNLTAFYVAVVAVLGLTSARALQLRTVAWGCLGVLTAVAVYAFLGKALPAVVTHAHAYARLDSPVGYWNALALMMVMGICVALAVGGDRGTHVALRTVVAAAAVLMCFTFFFTFSRGGWVVLVVGLVLYFAFTSTRLTSFITLVAAAVPVTLVLLRLRGLETLFATTTDDALRASQGGVLLRWAIAAVLAAAGVQLAAALLQKHVPWPRWSRVVGGAAVIAAVLVVVVGGSVWFLRDHGGVSWVSDKVHALFTDAESEQNENAASRLFTVTTNGRIPLWREALRQSEHNRLSGTGAGTFAFTHYRFRDGGGVVKHAHSQWFNVLSELGVVGLVLLVVAVVLMLVAMIGNPLSCRGDPLRPLLVALQAGVIAFFVHISADWQWDMAAVGTLAFVFIAVCVSYRTTRAGDDRRAAREEAEYENAAVSGTDAEANGAAARVAAEGGAPDAVGDEAAVGASHAAELQATPDTPPVRRRRLGWGPRVVASVALVLLAVSWLPPYLSQRAQNAALAAASDGEVATALSDARRAAALDPLSVAPLLTQATLLQQEGKNREALAKLHAATKLQPENYEAWYDLGVLLHGALGRDKQARAAFVRALALNPNDSASRYELELLAR